MCPYVALECIGTHSKSFNISRTVHECHCMSAVFSLFVAPALRAFLQDTPSPSGYCEVASQYVALQAASKYRRVLMRNNRRTNAHTHNKNIQKKTNNDKQTMTNRQINKKQKRTTKQASKQTRSNKQKDTHISTDTNTHTTLTTNTHTDTHTCSDLSYRILMWNASVVQKHFSYTWREGLAWICVEWKENSFVPTLKNQKKTISQEEPHNISRKLGLTRSSPQSQIAPTVQKEKWEATFTRSCA